MKKTYMAQRRRKRKKKLYQVTILILLIIGTSSVIQRHRALNNTRDNLTVMEVPLTEKNEKKQSISKADEWNLVLVNKWNPLPENTDINLVEVPGGEMVDERIYDQLMKMLEAAKEANLNQLPQVVSGYRTATQQQQLYDEKIAKYKQEGYSNVEAVKAANQWVAVPGYSEHQLGVAVDLNGATYDLYFWLQENSYKYGFIFRYPGGKSEITGIAEEVWHYRYVGVDAATKMYKQGLCLEEYLTQIEK